MPGGRRTHNFPHGRPSLLTVIEIAFAVSIIASVVVFGFKDWRSATPTLALVAAYLATYSILIRRYERTGQAVRRRAMNVMVRFSDGYPKPLLAARYAFFIMAALMLVFGFGPFGFDVAKKGIIGCVFGLVGVVVLNLLLERHYVRAGRGIEVKLTTTPADRS